MLGLSTITSSRATMQGRADRKLLSHQYTRSFDKIPDANLVRLCVFGSVERGETPGELA